MKLTEKQRAMLAVIAAAGVDGASFEQIGVKHCARTLPTLIFGGLVEYVDGSEPWRYRVKKSC